MREADKARREAQAARAKAIRDKSAARRSSESGVPDIQKALADAEASIAMVKDQIAKEAAAKKPERKVHGEKEPSVPNKKREHEPSTTRTMTAKSVRPPETTRDPLPFPQVGNGVNGSLVFQDCDGAETGRIEWVDGLIVTSGEQTIESGCGASSSSPYSPFSPP